MNLDNQCVVGIEPGVYMRAEATIEEWNKLYEIATRIKTLKPWEFLWDMDIFGILTGDIREETVFYSVLGRGGSCIGISIYEGYEAFNSYMMLTMQERMNISVEYAMPNQKCMSCYWGSREELSIKQREIISDLGYKFRGKNNWLYFMSYEPGYYPYNLDRNEVLRLTSHLENFQLAFTCYLEKKIQIDFEKGNMFSFVLSNDREKWHFEEEPLPLTSFSFGNLIIEDEDLLVKLKKAPKRNVVLEMEVSPLGASVTDKKFDRPANPMLSGIVDASSGMAISFEMNEPEDDCLVTLANCLIDFIFKYGLPREIRVSNVIVEATLEQICEICRIKLRKVKTLHAMDDFINSMRKFR